MKKILSKLLAAKANAKKNNKGFTLIELVVVIAIIAVLVTLIAPNLIGYLGQAKTTKGDAAAKSVYTALVAYSATNTPADGTDVALTVTAGVVQLNASSVIKDAPAAAAFNAYFNASEMKDISAIKYTAAGGAITKVTVTLSGTDYSYPKS